MLFTFLMSGVERRVAREAATASVLVHPPGPGAPLGHSLVSYADDLHLMAASAAGLRM